MAAVFCAKPSVARISVHGYTVRIEGDAILKIDDHVVIPGGQRLRYDFMECDAHRQRIRKRPNRLLEAVALSGNGFLPVLATLAVERTDRQTGDGMNALPGQPGLLQGVLNNHPVQPRPRVAFKMCGHTVNGTN